MKRYYKIITLLLIGFLSMQSCNSSNRNNKMANQPQSKLLKAVSEKDVQLVRAILNSKPDLEIQDKNGRTALMIAAYNHYNKIAALLIAAGADVNAQDTMQNSPFLYAGAEGNVELLKMGLENGANFNLYNRYGGTALIPAAEKGHLEVVKILTKIPDYPIDHINKLGWTALLEAVILSVKNETQTAIVKTLIDAGADVNIADNDGVTSLQHAKDKGLDDIVYILLKSGAK
ncbi:ankyrin repeat domain-containing protein [Aequorivita capsosiphonis]|uniref:ankyrin repeat domain-containing protein n=1 Tax=Aequorivita capsosiphonis TaxID=487317 RepID=UPI00047921BB|nr:ankyrin repeat domain-containing protein [Aequorivita capsosiphonis]